MSYLDWKVGDRVVCVDDSPGRCLSFAGENLLVLGRVYVIREVFVSPNHWSDAGSMGIKLQGMYGLYHRSGDELGFNVSRFRKVQARKTDISVFTAMLTDNRVEVSA